MSDDSRAALAALGYRQELRRGMSGFGSFAISLSVISILTGGVSLYGYGLRLGGPLLRCSQITEDERGRAIERCEMVYRGDRYRFRATLVRAATAAGAHQPEAG